VSEARDIGGQEAIDSTTWPGSAKRPIRPKAARSVERQAGPAEQPSASRGARGSKMQQGVVRGEPTRLEHQQAPEQQQQAGPPPCSRQCLQGRVWNPLFRAPQQQAPASQGEVA